MFEAPIIPNLASPSILCGSTFAHRFYKVPSLSTGRFQGVPGM